MQAPSLKKMRLCEVFLTGPGFPGFFNLFAAGENLYYASEIFKSAEETLFIEGITLQNFLNNAVSVLIIPSFVHMGEVGEANLEMCADRAIFTQLDCAAMRTNQFLSNC